jgi:hypothetical protein
MIILKEGINTAVFTFNERIVNPYNDPYFLWRITNALTSEEILFTNNIEMSANPERFNAFSIEILTAATASEDLNHSILAFTASGLGSYGYDGLSQWKYDAWICQGPMPQTGTVSFPAVYSHVESGRMIMTY